MRWTLLGAAFLATVIAIVYPLDDTEGRPVAPQPSPESASVVAISPVAAVVQVATTVADVEGDPFAPRGWQVLPPPVSDKVPAPVAAVALAPAPTAPPLPFQYMGSMSEEGRQTIYLGHGDQALVVHSGEIIAQTYKVVEINGREIQFEHLPTGQRQLLGLPTQE